jgi:hypothetical protein
MKILTTITIALLLVCSAAAQTVKSTDPQAAPTPTSKLQQFSSRAGTLIQKDFTPVGDFSGIKVEVLRINDLIGKLSIAGVRLSKTMGTSYSTDEKIAFLDADEVDGLLKSIDLLRTSVFTSSPANYSEVIFTARAGMEAGGYYSDARWKAFIKLEKYDSRSSVFMQPEDLAKLGDMLVKVKDQLK